MIDSMGESRWLDVEARERLELDLMKSVTIRDWRSNHVAEENDNNSALSWQFFGLHQLPTEARKLTPPKSRSCLKNCNLKLI